MSSTCQMSRPTLYSPMRTVEETQPSLPRRPGTDLGQGQGAAGVPRAGLGPWDSRRVPPRPCGPASQPAQGPAQCWQGEHLATIELFSLQLARPRAFRSWWRFMGSPERWQSGGRLAEGLPAVYPARRNLRAATSPSGWRGSRRWGQLLRIRNLPGPGDCSLMLQTGNPRAEWGVVVPTLQGVCSPVQTSPGWWRRGSSDWDLALADVPVFMWVLVDCLRLCPRMSLRENRGLSFLPSAVSSC